MTNSIDREPIGFSTRHCRACSTFTPFVLTWMLFTAAGALAEVYRWVDENGKVHYSDRKPKSAAAEDISAEVSKSNIDESSAETRKLQKIFAEETEAEKELREARKARQNARREKLRTICAQAREQLAVLKGRVYFIDDKGQPYNISEKERQQQERELEAQIQEHCK